MFAAVSYKTRYTLFLFCFINSFRLLVVVYRRDPKYLLLLLRGYPHRNLLLAIGWLVSWHGAILRPLKIFFSFVAAPGHPCVECVLGEAILESRSNVSCVGFPPERGWHFYIPGAGHINAYLLAFFFSTRGGFGTHTEVFLVLPPCYRHEAASCFCFCFCFLTASAVNEKLVLFQPPPPRGSKMFLPLSHTVVSSTPTHRLLGVLALPVLFSFARFGRARLCFVGFSWHLWSCLFVSWSARACVHA